MVSENRYEEALEKGRIIQVHEPTNKMIKDYVSALTTLIHQQGSQ